MKMFEKRLPKREFKLNTHLDKEPDDPISDDGKFVHFSKPDRSHYPRILDFWPVFVVVGILTVATILILRWLS